MFYSPLRYPGGKGKLASFFADVMRSNRISGGTYIEPYVGGAGVALYLLLKEYVKEIIINDLDPAVFLFWFHILNNTNAFIKWLKSVDVNMHEWHKFHEIIMSKYGVDDFELAKAFFFLNRTNRSGVVKGGVIGGQNQNGRYQLDVRFNKQELIERIERIVSYKDRIKLTNLDASILLEKYVDYDDPRSLIYLDPPYYEQGGELYMNSYTDEGHTIISKLISQLKTPWVLTYDDHPWIRKLYRRYKPYNLSVQYHAQDRRVENELLFCRNLDITHTINDYGLVFAS